MPHAQATSPIHRPRPVKDQEKLIALIRTMALEMERLNEDNLQLNAAIQMYREVLRRNTCKAS